MHSNVKCVRTLLTMSLCFLLKILDEEDDPQHQLTSNQKFDNLMGRNSCFTRTHSIPFMLQDLRLREEKNISHKGQE